MIMALPHKDATLEATGYLQKTGFCRDKAQMSEDKARLEPEAKCPQPITGFQDEILL